MRMLLELGWEGSLFELTFELNGSGCQEDQSWAQDTSKLESLSGLKAIVFKNESRLELSRFRKRRGGADIKVKRLGRTNYYRDIMKGL